MMNLVNVLDNVYCSGLGEIGFDRSLPEITNTLVTLIKIGVPLLLILFGMLDLGKAVMAQKDDEIKKGQKTLITRCIAGVIVFFVVVVVQLLVGVVAGNDKAGISGCLNCFVGGKGNIDENCVQ